MVQQSHPARIVHESETQRQHIRVQIPALAKMGGKNHRIANISTGGFSIKAEKDFVLPDHFQEIKILFPFKNLAFHLNLKAAPVYHDKKRGMAGFLFQEMN